MEKKFKYDAFISYRHQELDKAAASKLQKMLESYKPPGSKKSDNSKKIRIFRDETELNSSNDLSAEIKTALEESRRLIVVCSKTTKDSRWCKEEINYFKELHKGSNMDIIPLVVDGEASEVFPDELCHELVPITDEDGNITYEERNIEPLAANISSTSKSSSMKKLKSEFLRIAAPLMDCDYDTLYNREQKRKVRKFVSIGALIASVLLLFGVYTSAMLLKISSQKLELEATNNVLHTKTLELNHSNDTLLETVKQLEQKTKEAEENLKEANKQKLNAEINLAEAEKQRKIAEENLEEAIRQKKLAEHNLEEANRQRTLAETNRAEAEKQKYIALSNEAKAVEANKSLRIKNSEILTSQAWSLYDNNYRYPAVELALQALPQDDEDYFTNFSAQDLITRATNSYSSKSIPFAYNVTLSGYVSYLEISEDGSRVLASDSNGSIYIIDPNSGKILNIYLSGDVFDSPFANIDRIFIEDNTGYAYCNNQLLSLNLHTGAVNWSYKVSDDLTSGDILVTNPNLPIMAIVGNDHFSTIEKSTGETNVFPFSNAANFDTASDYFYMDSESNIYCISPTKKTIYQISLLHRTITSSELDTNIDSFDVLCVREIDSLILIDIVDRNAKTEAQVLAVTKEGLYPYWNTKYHSKDAYFSTHDYNNITKYFTVKWDDEIMNFRLELCIALINGREIFAFDSHGTLIFEKLNDYPFKSFEADVYTMDVKIIDSAYSYSKMWLSGKNSVVSSKYLYFGDEYSLADANEDFYAVANDTSTAIKILNKKTFNKFIELKNFPYDDYPLDSDSYAEITNNKNTLFALCKVNDKTSNVLIYDIAQDQTISSTAINGCATSIRFIGDDKIALTDQEGNITVLNSDGSILDTVNIPQEIYTQLNKSRNIVNPYSNVLPNIFKISQIPINIQTKNTIHINPDGSAYSTEVVTDEFNSISLQYLASLTPGSPFSYTIPDKEDGIIYDFGDVFVKVTLSEDQKHIIIKAFNTLDNNHFIKYCSISDNGFAYTESSDLDDIISYFDISKEEILHISNGGEVVAFDKGTITSPVLSNTSQHVAFIDNSGYIGIYDTQSKMLNKIPYTKSSIIPIKVSFTPDSKYIITMSSDGRFTKYSVDTLKEEKIYTSSFVINPSTTFEYASNNILVIRELNFAISKAEFIDIDSMEKLSETSDFIGFMNEGKTILSVPYTPSGDTKYGYYHYLSTEEVKNAGLEFLNTFE